MISRAWQVVFIMNRKLSCIKESSALGLIGGFLGAGKTTLIGRVVKSAAFKPGQPVPAHRIENVA